MKKAIVRPRTLGCFSLGVLSLLIVNGCRHPAPLSAVNPKDSASSSQLTISAAASLKNVMEDIKPLYQEAYPDTKIIYNFASSGSLQRQIEQGAPVDVFISAALDHMDTLEAQGLILTETRRDFLTNQIVLVTPSNPQSRLKLNAFTDLATTEITTVALGIPQSVPAGKYAQEVLTSLQIADAVKAKAVYGRNVRQVLNYVATGNVDAGLVYRTDAEISSQVKIVAIAPENTHSPVIYPIAVTQESDHPETATTFVEFMDTPEAQAVFEDYGFTPSLTPGG